jgi:hypothetical protein
MSIERCGARDLGDRSDCETRRKGEGWRFGTGRVRRFLAKSVKGLGEKWDSVLISLLSASPTTWKHPVIEGDLRVRISDGITENRGLWV